MMARRASHYRMPRWCIPALFSLLLAVSPVSAQFGGIRFPGMGGRNPNGYPGQQGQNAPQNTSKAYGTTEDLTGTLQQISSSNLVIDAGDDRIVLVQIQSGTKYLSTMDKVKASDFEPGDHVTVEATRDSNDHYYSKSVTMNKKGTPEEKAAAMQAANSSHSGSGGGGSSSSDSDSDPDRPRLHRANPDDGSSGTQTASAPSSAGAPPSAETNSRSSSNSDSNGGGSASSGSGSSSRQSAGDDDAGPPVLHRSSAPANPPSDTQVASSPSSSSASSSSPSEASGARPSLSAEDVNGVTRLPTVPPPTANSDNTGVDREAGAPRDGNANGNYGGGDPIIEQAREAAFSFTETLPNYVVKQLTNRYATDSANRGRTSWQPLDIVTTDLVYEDGKERYTNIMINGKPTKYIEQTGSWSEGEFASMLQAILAPGTNADFRNQHPVTIVNRPSYRYDYTVEQPRSTWTLHADGQTYSPSYTGSIWIDKATYRVLRIEIAARNLPRDFPLDTAESSIDYDFVTIGEKKVLLPADAESLSCTRGTSDCSKNHTEFHNYKKYGADTSITFEGDADNK